MDKIRDWVRLKPKKEGLHSIIRDVIDRYDPDQQFEESIEKFISKLDHPYIKADCDVYCFADKETQEDIYADIESALAKCMQAIYVGEPKRVTGDGRYCQIIVDHERRLHRVGVTEQVKEHKAENMKTLFKGLIDMLEKKYDVNQIRYELNISYENPFDTSKLPKVS